MAWLLEAQLTSHVTNLDLTASVCGSIVIKPVEHPRFLPHGIGELTILKGKMVH
jgi:hypothetical protein